MSPSEAGLDVGEGMVGDERKIVNVENSADEVAPVAASLV